MSVKVVTIEELRKLHPMPWRYTVAAAGEILVIDAGNCVVPLFTMLDLVVRVTTGLAAQQPTPEAKPA